MEADVSLWRKPWQRKLLGLLGLRTFAWRTYCRLRGPSHGVRRVEVAAVTGEFYVHSRSYAEALSNSLGGERNSMEECLRALRAGDCAYDVGADIGHWTVFLARAVGERGEVVAFEPARDRAERLQEHLRLNRLRNVKILRLALGEQGSAAPLYRSRVGEAATLVPENCPSAASAVLEQVEIAAGDDLIERESLGLPRLVKIDVEGYECAVIRGLSRALSSPACQLVMCEIHPGMLPKPFLPDDVVGLLRSLGFRTIELHPRGGQFHAIARKSSGQAGSGEGEAA